MVAKTLFTAALVMAALAGPAGRDGAHAEDSDSAPAALAPVSYAPDRLLIQLAPGPARVAARAVPRRADGSEIPGATSLERIGVPAIDRLASATGARLEPEFRGERPPAPGSRDIDFTTFWIMRLPEGADREASLAALRSLREVESASPIAILPVAVIPNDSLWGYMPYFYQNLSRRDIHAPEAWDLTTGDTTVIVAIVDTGILPYHPDLSGKTPGLNGQLWTNWAEQGGVAGVDDDGNGFVDDTWGWDFVNLASGATAYPGEDWRDEDADPNDFASHGTAVAGVVGALSNNRIGVTGTAWNVRLMTLRVGWSSLTVTGGEVDMSYAAKAIRYATRMGASVINCSFTSQGESDLAAAVTAATAAGVLVVNAVGNNGDPQHYLSDREDVLAVAATDPSDRLAQFSNRGSYVDMSAPGSNLATTNVRRIGTDSLGVRQPAYTTGANGTSFAAPLCAGAAALVQAYRRAQGLPRLNTYELKMRLMDTADDISSQNTNATAWGNGRLNAYRALTDPPTSLARPLPTRTVGAAAVLPTVTGARRIVFACGDNRLRFMDGTTGAILRSAALTSPPAGGVSAADLGDGRGPGVFVATIEGRIFGFDGVGQPLPGWPVQSTRINYVRTLEPVLGDLDGDGVIEVVWGGVDGFIYAWHVDGTRVVGFPRLIGGSGESNLVALSDLDGKPGAEIIATNFWSSVHALRADGAELPGWPVTLDDLPTPPVVTRLGTSPDPAVIVTAGGRLTAFSPTGARVLDVDAPGLPVDAPALADFDGDGTDEIVLVRTSPDELVVLNSAGGLRMLRILSLPGYGPPIVGALGGGTTPALALCLRKSGGSQLIGINALNREMRGYPKTGRPGVDLSLDDVDGDGATDIVAGAGADSLMFVYDLGPGTFNAAAQHWPTPRGNFARTGSRLYSPPIGVVDDVPPVAVLDLDAAAVAETTMTLRWTAPSDVGSRGRPRRYELRRARAPIDLASFDSATVVDHLPEPGAPGVSDSVVVTGLAEGVHYFFSLRSVDEAGNPSPLSNPVAATTISIAPAVVSDLEVSATDLTGVTLAWTATGDDGATGKPARYLIHAAIGPLDESNFDAAPIALEVVARSAAGGGESARVGGLERGTRYHFALRAVDAAGNLSPISNIASDVAGPLGPRRGVAVAAGISPARVPVELYWQGTGTSPPGQAIRIYDLFGRLLVALPVTGDEGRSSWDGRDERGRAMPPGLYFARLSSGRVNTAARFVLLR